MNLLDKKLLGVVLVSALAFFSCEEENILGSNINPASDKLQVEFKEFTLPAQNVVLDSVRTDSDPYILTGAISDEIYGDIRATGFQNVNILSTVLPADSAVVDSVKLNLRFSGYFTDPIPTRHRIQIGQVTDTLYAGAVYQSSREVDYVLDGASQIDVIGSTEFVTSPATDSVLSITLDQAYGNMLFDKLEPIREGTFRTFAPGEINPIAVISGDNSESLIVFNPGNSASNITVYFHYPNTDSLTYNFTFRNASGNSLPHFNQITVDRSNSKLSGLTGEGKFRTIDADPNEVYMNPATGVLPLVDIREVYNFFKPIDTTGTNILNIMSSQILMPINPEDTSIYESNSGNLRYYFADEGGSFNGGAAVLNARNHIILNNNAYLPQGTPAVNSGVLDNNTFSIVGNITLFTQTWIQDEIDEMVTDPVSEPFTEYLVMTPALNSSFNQTTFFKDGIKIRVYYTVAK